MAKGKSSNILVWILMGLLILGLAGFGATNFGGSASAVARVGDTEITINRYARDLQQELRALSAQTGTSVTLSQAPGLEQQVLGRMIGMATLENEAARIGVSVGDERIAEDILALPAFAGVDGSFDREAYRFMLEQNGLTVAEFEERIRAETASQIVQIAVTSGAALPPAYAEAIFNFVRQERDVTWLRLLEADLAEPIREPSEADLTAFHTENADRYTLGETRQITYAWLTPDMIIDTVEIDEDAVRALYDERILEFVQPERRLVERLVFPSAADAEAARAAIAAGDKSFDDLVAERGLQPEDVDLGDVTQDDLAGAGTAVFALDEPGVAGPVETPLGPALFRMNAVLSAQETAFETARPELREALAAERARRIIVDAITDIDDLLAGGATLEELAEETDMDLGQIGWREDVATGIAGYEAFRAAAAAARDGDFPEVVELGDGGIFAMRLDAVRPAEVQPLADVRPRVIADWETAEVTADLAEQAETLAGVLRSGADFASVTGATVETETGLRRDGFILGTPDGFVTEIFAMEEGEIAVFDSPGQAIVVRLDAVRAPSLDDPEAVLLTRSVAEQANQGLASDILSSFIAAAQTEAGISVDQSAVNAVRAQFP